MMSMFCVSYARRPAIYQPVVKLFFMRENCRFLASHFPMCLCRTTKTKFEQNIHEQGLLRNYEYLNNIESTTFLIRNFHTRFDKLFATQKESEKDPFTQPQPAHPPPPPPISEKELAKMTLWDRFKKTFREYWYVLVPVHLITSLLWFGAFYYMAISGVDIVPLLEKMGAGKSITSKVEGTGAGYFAIAYALYKIATPARYTVTLGGTTVAINYLVKWGLIEPAPSPAKFHQFLRVKGALFFRRRRIRSRGKVADSSGKVKESSGKVRMSRMSKIKTKLSRLKFVKRFAK